MNRQRFLSIFYTKNQENPEKTKSEISARSSWNIFGSYESPNQMALVPNQLAQQNLSFSRQEVPEIILTPFLALVFATRVLQNHMFRQALGSRNDFTFG